MFVNTSIAFGSLSVSGRFAEPIKYTSMAMARETISFIGVPLPIERNAISNAFSLACIFDVIIV
jgi:hypothetical protein